MIKYTHLTSSFLIDIILIRFISTLKKGWLSTVELHGKRLLLKNADINDAETLLSVFNSDKQFNIWSGLEPIMSLEAIRAELQETLALPEGTVWQISDGTGTPVGVAETALLHPQDGAWIALLLIKRDFQGSGYGSEAATLLEKNFFSAPEINQIGLAVLVENTPALAFWEKRGYVRGKRTLDQHGSDVYEYSLKHTIH